MTRSQTRPAAMPPTSTSPSPGDLVALSARCSTKRDLRLIHGALLRRRHLLPAADAVAALAKLLRFAAVSPAGDLRQAAVILSTHLPFITSASTHPAFFYNTLMRGLAASSSPADAIGLFAAMRRAGAAPDAFTFTFVLKSCSRCPSGRRLPSDLHAQAIRHGCLGELAAHTHVHNALLHAYACRAAVDDACRVFEEIPARDVISFSGLLTAHLKANDLDAARLVFDKMPHRDVVSWTAMISAYAKACRPQEALALFDAMPMQPDEVTMVSIVSACTTLGDLATGERVRRHIDSLGFGWMMSLRNALMDMYAKCGSLPEARALFDGMTVRSLASWNTLISAYASHGDLDNTIAVFYQMLAEGNTVKPDGVTFLAVLMAYAYNGCVEEGRAMFNAMQQGGYGKVELTVEHYGCVVDMLGRAGKLEEAYQMIEQMPIPSNAVIWGALLGACRTHGDIDMAERAVQELRNLKPEEGGYYILLSDMYTSAGRIAEATEIRRAMNERGVQKTTGRSTAFLPQL
ncbi:pentatricopeptide repeat-containing protein At5g15300-like [Triticum dicoccoides]|nr:pentatricopeptide repeat-containing protein At5g15300-like [Triticum dicoccoides]XP_037426229.1 pentatricopeptide repeat-containing protein At5g15300-like [Triticum dicoccoides]XP_037426230.1 pentatricopeptide repeat-containing protein At5g15300-like [Triticum dicoccoides]XP_037426231.1 pentatricopeptide repeat-containing protein At5g15300-like [Triticum dicoccoides]XP_037426232.1 pentatricopeptide repeat-containing protein At5g15300-like [Triticum dicoccoides]